MTLRFDIREFDEVTSTNDVVKQAAAEGGPEGLVVCARRQSAGYGRRGHRWESGPGSLYMSLLLRPQAPGARVQTLPLATAVAVRRGCASLLPEAVRGEVMVKWPNDVVVGKGGEGGFRKLCGISLERKAGALCVGIGVNVAPCDGLECDRGQTAVTPPVASRRNQPTFLSDLLSAGECPAVPQVRDAVLDAFASIYKVWEASGFAALREEYLAHFALLGAKVSVREAALAEGGQSAAAPTRASSAASAPLDIPCCEVRGVDDDGHLLAVRCKTGQRLVVAAGTVRMAE